LKTNFRKNEDKESQIKDSQESTDKKDLTPEEYEKFIVDSGAKGSFMVYRSAKKDEELGLDEL
jgi:hypothetical protein